jgi:hypothetical protein
MQAPMNPSVRDLPDWVKRELLPTKNFPEQITDQSFLRAVNGSIFGGNDLRYVNFEYANYVDVPTSFPVDVKTMIDFAKVNKLDLHLYMYEELGENSQGNAGRVYSIYNSNTQGRRVFLLLHDDREFPIRNPFKLLKPQLKSRRPVYCYRCGATCGDSQRRNKHYQNCKSTERGAFYNEVVPNRMSLPQKVITNYL